MTAKENNMTSCIVRWLKSDFNDPVGRKITDSARRILGIDTGSIRTAKIYLITSELTEEQTQQIAKDAVSDAILHDFSTSGFPAIQGFSNGILIAKRPGVTDDEGMSLQRLISDVLDQPFSGTQQVFSQDYYFIEKKLSNSTMKLIASSLLANPLINHIEVGEIPEKITYIPHVQLQADKTVTTVDIDRKDNELLNISKQRLLALNLEEMKTIRDFFTSPEQIEQRREAGFPAQPTDAELEIIAQTWSEHCKHKEFAAKIFFEDHESGQTHEIDSLFKTYIKGATQRIIDEHKNFGTDWLVKVFNDNAGIVKIDKKRLFVWKVETHNSPSALDPYGGALTGIVGVNRDPMGTGRGGARLLFNTDVLCFAPPDFKGELFPGQLTPRQIMNGVRQGIEDGGNKSGIPTINGAVVFDERFRAKPLVFCGTAGILPADWQGRAAADKEIAAGDLIAMTGGRVGKDGIHGATFSSVELDEHSPATAVQIGSPITQKFMSDFLEEALKKGLIKCWYSSEEYSYGLVSSLYEKMGLNEIMTGKVDVEQYYGNHLFLYYQ